MEKRGRAKCFMAATLFLCTLLFFEKRTGEAWHAFFGVLLIGMQIWHFLGQRQKLKLKSRRIRAVDGVLLISLALMLGTGVLLHPLGDWLVIKIWHKLAAVLFVLGIAVHTRQHIKIALGKDRRKDGYVS